MSIQKINDILIRPFKGSLKGFALSFIMISCSGFAGFNQTAMPATRQANISLAQKQNFNNPNLENLLRHHGEQSADDTLYALLKKQTDQFSTASDLGDTIVMGALIDNDLLFSNGSGNVYAASALAHSGEEIAKDRPDQISTLLKQRTQEFIDAGQRGDITAMKQYLDPDVLFLNADGILSQLTNFTAGAIVAPAKGVSSTITVKDWVLHHSGDVAVSCYIQDQVGHYGEKTLSEKFRTVEAWVNHNGTWELFGSETIPFHQDPPAVTLSQDVLKEYEGVYIGASGAASTISRNGNALAATREGKSTPLVAEARDVFFIPGDPSCYPRTHYVFLRNSTGRVTGSATRTAGGDLLSKKVPSIPQGNAATPQNPASTLTIRDFVVHRSGDVAFTTLFHDRVTRYAGGQVLKTTYRSSETWVKRGAAWKMITSQGRALQVDPPAITLKPSELNDYVGTYTISPGFNVKILLSGDALMLSMNGAKAIVLDAEVHDVFFAPGSPRSRIIFQRDTAGRITGYARRGEGRDLVFSKTN